jgi:hypothetical protein
VDNILGEQNTLELKKKEVDELFEVLQNCLNGFLGHGVVFARTERAGEAL